MAVDMSPHSLSPLAGKLPCGLFSSRMTKTSFWHHRLAACSPAGWADAHENSVHQCGISYHRCLGPALHETGSCGKWPSCPLAFMLGTGFQSSFEIWPPLGLQQPPLLGLSGGLWLLRARMGAGMLEHAVLTQQLASPGRSCWHGELLGSELWLISSVSSWHPEGKPRAGRGSALLQAGPEPGERCAWARPSTAPARPAAHHSCLLR